VLERTIDLDRTHACPDLELFVAATNVRTGQARIFRKQEVTIDAILASACLPFLFQAIEIDGEHYWDGGYTANPALWPFFYADVPADIVIVHVNPMVREGGPPKSAAEIVDRVNEVTFNAALLSELRAIEFVKKLKRQHWLPPEADRRYREMRVHSIRADRALAPLGANSKYRTDRAFLAELAERGRAAASDWLEACYADVGKRSTIDVQAEYLDL